MDPDEVIVKEMQSKRGLKTSKFLRKRIGKPRKSTHIHAHGQILPFHQRRGNVLSNRLSDDRDDLDVTDVARTITMRAINNVFGD